MAVSRALKEALESTQGPFKAWNSKGANERYKKLVELGVVNTNVRLGDILRLVDDIGFAGGPLSYAGTTKPLKAWQKLLKGTQDAYVAEDDFWKLTNFSIERMRLKRKFPQHTDDMLDAEAADIVRNTVPNYEYVGNFQRGLRFSPIGNFVSFPSEMIRTSFNIVDRGIKEVTRGLKTRNANDVADGMKRILGFTTGAIMGGEAFVHLGQSAHNISEKTIDAMRRFAAPWAKDAPLMPTGQDEDGNYKFIDLGNILAYETVIEPARAIGLEIAAGEDDPERLAEHLKTGAGRAIYGLLEPFVSESIWFGLVQDLSARDGRTREGTRVWNAEDPPGDKIVKALEYLVTESLPLNWKQMQRILKARNGEQYDLGNEIWGTTGMRQQVIDPVYQMPFKIYEYQGKIKNGRKMLYDITHEGGKKFPDVDELTPSRLMDAYRDFMRVSFDAQKELSLDLQAAQTLGMTKQEIYEVFEGRLSPKILDSILKGEFYAPEIPKSAIDAMYDNSRAKDIPNPFPAAKYILRNLLKENDRKSLMDDQFDPLLDIEMPGQRGAVPSNAPAPVQIAQSYTSPGIVLPPQAQNQYNPATGLNRTETALLSPSDQEIRKQQRGIV